MSIDLYVMLSWAIVPLGLLRYQIKDTRIFLGFNAFMGVCVATLYLAEGALAGALVSTASASALLAQFIIGHKVNLKFRLMIAAPAILVAFFMRENAWYGALPLLAFAAARIAEAVRHDLGLRITLLGCTGLWIIYGLVVGIPQIVAFEMLGLASNAIGIWRIYGQGKKTTC